MDKLRNMLGFLQDMLAEDELYARYLSGGLIVSPVIGNHIVDVDFEDYH